MNEETKWFDRALGSIGENSAEVLRELSPILAGAKLATIILGYVGVGSFAKWVIEEWYPFTRWVWDQVTVFLDLPSLSQIEKDSLTVLVFFLPLGISAFLNKVRGNTEQNPTLKTRFISALFGIFCILIICFDLIDFLFLRS